MTLSSTLCLSVSGVCWLGKKWKKIIPTLLGLSLKRSTTSHDKFNSASILMALVNSNTFVIFVFVVGEVLFTLPRPLQPSPVHRPAPPCAHCVRKCCEKLKDFDAEGRKALLPPSIMTPIRLAHTCRQINVFVICSARLCFAVAIWVWRNPKIKVLNKESAFNYASWACQLMRLRC